MWSGAELPNAPKEQSQSGLLYWQWQPDPWTSLEILIELFGKGKVV